MTRNKAYFGAASALALAISLAGAGVASAQSATSTLRGTIYEGQAVETGGTVTATEVSTGYVSRGRIAQDGGYIIPGLRPGTYRIAATSADGQAVEDTITISLGQVVTLDLDVASSATVVAGSTSTSDATELGEIVVTGRRIFEVRTSEVATNVSQTQINNLPQINRNFLNFAALAPGVRVTEGDTERTISAGGQGAAAINVFIDGQNQKSTILDGGVGGQDDSRGNPFPQGAVQEFRVISQNFKAEYEQASSSIITAVTRSGTNEFTGDAFVSYQAQDWSAEDAFGRQRSPERLQYGATIGGPIIEDRLHFFGSYERKDEERSNSVFINRSEFAGLFPGDVGTFAAPFEEDLFFGKLSWQIDDRQRVDLSATYRTEEDIRDFGNERAFSRGVRVGTEVTSVNLRHQFQGDGFLNEASVDFYEYGYSQDLINDSDYGREYVLFSDADTATGGFQYSPNSRETTVFNTGGRSGRQTVRQRNWTFKNDLTFTDIEFMGSHTLKMGAKLSAQNMYVFKELGRNPQFVFDIEGRPEINGSIDIPVLVNLNGFVPAADVNNNVVGLYIQDDWQISSQLEINLGIRWDYEDNALNNDYSTPQDIRDMLAAIQARPDYDFPSYFNPSDYITDGRDAFTGAFQPRIGFSYDVFDDERTVIFGGAGRYYDRVGFNFAFDERYKPYEFGKTIYFSQTGGTVAGNPTVAWNPIYLTPEGLDPLLEAAPGAGEVVLLRNDAEPPRTDQFNLGIRQKFGEFQTSLTFAYGHTENLFGNYIANPAADGNRFNGPTPTSVGFPQFRNLFFFSNHDAKQHFKAMYLTVDKPFTVDSNWGVQFSYTLSEARRNGVRNNGDYEFDYNSVATSQVFPTAQDERHRIVASGIVGLPWDMRLSGIVTLGSGLPFNVFNCPDAVNPNICWNGGRPPKRDFLFFQDAFAFRQVDLRLTKRFDVPFGDAVEIMFDAVNVFNFENYSSFEGDFNNPNFGKTPFDTYLPTRSFQVGLRYTW